MFLHVSVTLFTGCGLHPGGWVSSRGLHRRGVGRPPIRYYGIRSTRGRYASYWNAFLFKENLCLVLKISRGLYKWSGS